MEKLTGNELAALATKIRKVNEERFHESCRKRLDNIISKKMRTTFIGALSIFEDHFGFLWGQNESGLTSEQRKMLELWKQVRTEVLNLGNTQLRGAQNEIANQTVIWNRYRTEFKIIPQENQ